MMPGLQDIPSGLQDSTMTAIHNNLPSEFYRALSLAFRMLPQALKMIPWLFKCYLGPWRPFHEIPRLWIHLKWWHWSSSSSTFSGCTNNPYLYWMFHSILHLFSSSSSLPHNASIASLNHLKLHKFHSFSEVESNSSLQIPPFQPCPLSSPHLLPSPPNVPASTPPNVSPCPPALLLPFPYLLPKFQTHLPSHSPSPSPLPPKPSLAFFPEEPPRYLPFPISNAPQCPVSSETTEGHNGNGFWSIQNKQVQQTGTESVTTTEWNNYF